MISVWIVAPALLLALAYGIGLSLTMVTRKPLDFTMVALLGFLLIIIIGSLLTISPATAPYTTLSIWFLVSQSSPMVGQVGQDGSSLRTPRLFWPRPPAS